MSILYAGIDVSKQKIDVAISFEGNEFKSNVFKNNLSGFKQLSSWLEKFKYSNIHFCLEYTNIYHSALAEYLKTFNNNTVSIINPYQSKHFAQSVLIRTKTDSSDACILARYALIHKPKESFMIKKEIKELRELTRYLESLKEDRKKEKIKLETLQNNDLRNFVYKKIDYITNLINEVEQKIKNFIDLHSSIKQKISLLQSIEGIGIVTSWILLSEMLDEENIPPKSQVAYAGLDPIEKRSGSSVNGKSRISSKGNSRLRKCLYMPALGRIKKGGYFGTFYQKLVSKGKPKKVAITAVMKKMLLTAAAILNNNEPFDPDWSTKQSSKFVLSS